jgi:acylphosphatase
MKKLCIHYFVSGLVQGVFFRDWTRQKAEALDITGWIKNMNDGRVEVMACGEQEKLAEFESWLWEGSPASKVNKVISREEPWSDYDDFMIVH